MQAQLSGQLTTGQQYILQVMANPALNEEDLNNIRRMISQYLVHKLDALVTDAWQRNGWTEADEERLLNTHLRTPYKLPRQEVMKIE